MSREITVQFLMFPDCPMADAARQNLRAALARLDSLDFEEIDISDRASEPGLRGWGSPTILINGVDIVNSPPGDSISCRVYDTADGAPSVSMITAALNAARVE